MNDKKPLLLGPTIGGLLHTGVKLWGRAPQAATLHAWLSSTGPERMQPAEPSVRFDRYYLDPKAGSVDENF